MKTPLLLLGAATLAGCGNLSNEDLIFLAGIPKAKEVTLEVQDPGTSTALSQALVGQQAEMFTGALALATGINAGVEGLLKFVDSLGRGNPPTERTDDSRIWGPIENVDKKGITLRLEIKREENANGGTRFTFCLQMARDADYTGAPATCSDSTASGLRSILYGHYDPRNPGGGARSGSGEIFLDFDAARSIGGNQGNEAGLFAVTYDFSAGGDSKSLAIDWTGPQATTLAYDYLRDDTGHVDFSFAVSNIDTGDPNSRPANWSIVASWAPGAGGRGDAVGTGGTLRIDQSATATECWDANHRRTYWHVVVLPEDTVLADEGNIANCP